MAPPRRADLPSDTALVALVALHGSYVGVDRAVGLPEGTTIQYVARQSRGALRATCDAYVRPPSHHTRPRHAYPVDDALLDLMREHRSFSAVAGAVGRRRESLRDYLVRRPALDAAMRALLPARLTDAERQEATRRCAREYQRKQRLAEPSTARARRRLSMAGRKGTGTKPPLDPEINAYATILRADPCSYCDATADHIDHIDSVKTGGDTSWGNLTAACAPCNQRKAARSLLVFLAGGR